VRAVVAAYPLEGLVRAAVLALKYRGRTRLAPFLAAGLSLPLAHRPLSVDRVIPVPLSPGRLRVRGFNQSELLARPVAKAFQWELDTTSLTRQRETRQQTRLSVQERQRNVAGAFAVTDPGRIRGARVLLVDDVCTTGATLDACAQSLIEAGAEGVWAIVVAREV
jgi:ComF family protein